MHSTNLCCPVYAYSQLFLSLLRLAHHSALQHPGPGLQQSLDTEWRNGNDSEMRRESLAGASPGVDGSLLRRPCDMGHGRSLPHPRLPLVTIYVSIHPLNRLYLKAIQEMLKIKNDWI